MSPMFDSVPLIAGGLLAGVVFGFLLQKGGVATYKVIVGQFLLVDHTVARVMGTAIVVGAVGVYGLLALGLIDGLMVKPAMLVANAVGGLIFGVGMVGLGYCPGTGVAAAGSGSRHAWFGILGMLVGAALFTETFPWARRTFMEGVDLGKVTIADLTGVSPWVFVGLLVAGAAVFYTWLDRRP
jgi:uncharacterized protein